MVAGVLVVPPAHLPGQTAEAASGQTPRPAKTTSAEEAQHSRGRPKEPHARMHVQ